MELKIDFSELGNNIATVVHDYSVTATQAAQAKFTERLNKVEDARDWAVLGGEAVCLGTVVYATNAYFNGGVSGLVANTAEAVVATNQIANAGKTWCYYPAEYLVRGIETAIDFVSGEVSKFVGDHGEL